jgi:hypothetical protein
MSMGPLPSGGARRYKLPEGGPWPDYVVFAFVYLGNNYLSTVQIALADQPYFTLQLTVRLCTL